VTEVQVRPMREGMCMSCELKETRVYVMQRERTFIPMLISIN
jgi:hypothetical protein